MDKNVWINGTFDVLHNGHFKMINYAASLGKLIIGIDGDNRVKELKGSGRPYHNQSERKYNLLSINGVYDVLIFENEKQLIDFLKKNNPDYFVIGSDYKDKKIIGSEYAKEMIYFDRINFSTTEILERWDINKNQML
jgi:D-beta-D-heptose 7-phosphate kinase/D-beta-D-heptose 1-phosphate adenosyltransferase